MPIVKDLASSNTSCYVAAKSPDVVSQLWFKTEPLDHIFCYRALQLQLITQSRDQGYADDTSAGSWSWFEIAVHENATSDVPKLEDDKQLVWRSHCNNLALSDTTQHFGMLFDRRHELLNISIEVGNVLAIRVCARFPGWRNEAETGKLVVKLLTEDTFIPNPWSLSSTESLGIYTVTSSQECHVISQTHELASKIWFATPPLDETVISKIEELQLFTRAHNQLLTNAVESGSWTWFDIVVLSTPESTTPKVKNGRSLEWQSHTTVVGQVEDTYQAGSKFDRNHELLGLLEVGDIVAVRVCAQFEGRKHLAHEARLTVRISTEGPAPVTLENDIDWEAIVKNQEKFKEVLALYLNRATPEGAPPAYSAEGYQVTAPLRADSTHGAGEAPLKLLSLDGGGVRGISSLQILYAIEKAMFKLTGDANTKPCEYFDMIAGTSTGGLIAIMLGRLKMSISACIEAYHRVASRIFGKKGWNGYYDPKVLEVVVKELVRDCLHDENATMMGVEEDKCKVFVVACQANNLSNATATHIRSYVNKEVGDSFTNWSIWEAARATSAAPTFFPSISVNGVEYIDGGMGFNNPVILLYSEAGLVFGRARPIECLVTIGTGMSPDVKIDGKPSATSYILPHAAEALKVLGAASIYLLTNGELAHLGFQNLRLIPDDAYYRFNFGEKNPDGSWKAPMQMDNWEGMHELERKTQDYLLKESEAERVNRCAKRIATSVKV